MVDRNKELAINTVILGIGQLIPKFLAIVLLPLLTSLFFLAAGWVYKEKAIITDLKRRIQTVVVPYPMCFI